MSFILLFSIVLKGIGALLEVLLQISITKELGVQGYGNYSTWINMADLIFWIFFSGLVKCNIFYLSGKQYVIHSFKMKYYSRYMLPIIVLIGIFGVNILKNPAIYLVLLITCLEISVYDQSSTLLAYGKVKKSLVGEYVLGRFILLIGVNLLGLIGKMTLVSLLILYSFQYILVIIFFCIKNSIKKSIKTDISTEISIKKISSYQWADFMYAMINQMPVVLQYFFSGAFEAGVVSIILLVKKLINFISGPTAKIFLPEFSKMYREGKGEEIREYYASIMRLQMLFVGPLAVVLLGFPNVVLRILAEELIGYSPLFMLCSFVFLLTATLGPCSGIMQMTGSEKKDNHCREAALLFMFVVLICFRYDKLSVLYGLCAQAVFEAIGKYLFVCKWMKKAPVSVFTYISWWFVPGVVVLLSYLFHIQNSIWGMIFLAGIVFIIEGVNEWREKDIISVINIKTKRK